MIGRRRFVQYSVAGVALQSHSFVFGSEGDAAAWKARADMPLAVQEIYPAIAGQQIHVAGGLSPLADGKVRATDAHLVYDIVEGRWHTRAALPAARHHLGLAFSGEQLFALGGFAETDQGDWSMVSQTWAYDAASDKWRAVASAPEIHAESVTLAAGGLIHVVGGRTPKGDKNAGWMDHTDSDRHLVYDSASDSWSRLAPAKYARNSAAGALIDGSLYVVGGRTVSGGNLAVLEVYDRREDRWREAAPMPRAQGGLAAATVAGKLIALGGEFFGADGFGVFGNVWQYSPDKDAWVALADMLTPRHGLGAVSDGNTIYAIGGAAEVGPRGTSNRLESLDL